jgi:hypothetical protein
MGCGKIYPHRFALVKETILLVCAAWGAVDYLLRS